jgi:hypothetical protein
MFCHPQNMAAVLLKVPSEVGRNAGGGVARIASVPRILRRYLALEPFYEEGLRCKDT